MIKVIPPKIKTTNTTIKAIPHFGKSDLILTHISLIKVVFSGTVSSIKSSPSPSGSSELSDSGSGVAGAGSGIM